MSQVAPRSRKGPLRTCPHIRALHVPPPAAEQSSAVAIGIFGTYGRGVSM